MIKRIISLMAVFFILLLALALFSKDGWGGGVGGTLSPIQEVQWIHILGKRWGEVMNNMKLKPFNKINIDRSTRVIWINQSDTPIRIKFGKGENCQDISRNLQRTDYWRKYYCHITEEPISPNGILEIFFNDPGSYDYEIQFVGTKSAFKAKLVVY
jgi:hypothetical protein